MGKTAFIFPGQGAQYVGMGQDFYDKMPVCRQVIDKASQVSGLDIPKICFTENEEINITEYTQIAMLSVEAAILKAMEQEGLVPDVSAPSPLPPLPLATTSDNTSTVLLVR